MLCDLETWQITTPNKEDIRILSEACYKNDDIADIIKKKYEPIRKKMPPPQFVQLTRSYLLDTKKKHFSLVEKYAYDIAMFQLRERNIVFNDDIYIQIGFKSGKTDLIRELHVDWFPNDESENQISLSSILYLNYSKRPSIFTDLTMSEYYNKNFENQKNICFSFPKPLKLITFNGRKYFHGYYDIFEKNVSDIDRPMIILKVWNCKTRPLIDYFDNTVFSLENTILKDAPSRINILPTSHAITIKDVIKSIDSDFFENLLYYPSIDLCYPFADYVTNIDSENNVIFHINNFKKKNNAYWLWMILIFVFVLFILFFLK
jgi:hypothetical protein